MEFINVRERTVAGMLNLDGTQRLEGAQDGPTINYKMSYRKGNGFVLWMAWGVTSGGFFTYKMFADPQQHFRINPCTRNTDKAFREVLALLPRVLKEVAYGDYLPHTEVMA